MLLYHSGREGMMDEGPKLDAHNRAPTLRKGIMDEGSD